MRSELELIGARLRELREESGMRLGTVAALVGITAAALQEIESGTAHVAPKLVWALIKAMGADPVEVVVGVAHQYLGERKRGPAILIGQWLADDLDQRLH